MKIKRPCLMFLTFLFFVILSRGHVYCAAPIRMYINGMQKSLETAPLELKGRILLPLRATLNALGIEPVWDSETEMISGTVNGTLFELKLDSKTVLINGEEFKLDAPVSVINGRAMVTADLLTDVLGFTMKWDGNTKTVLITKPSNSLSPENAEAAEIHRNSWENAARLAASRPDYKYAIYESRTLAVKHPEIYLRADAMFDRVLNDMPSMMEYYLDRSQDFNEQAKKYVDIASKPGRMFSWQHFDIKLYSETEHKDIYDSEAFLPFLDTRLHFMGTALKASEWRATSLSMAEFIYFKYKNEGRHPYLLVASDGSAYVSADRGLKERQLYSSRGEPVEKVKGNIILVFNEMNVWYPLMERDDTSRDTVLKALVKKYGDLNNCLPILDSHEIDIVSMMKNNTCISDDNDYLWALVFTGRIHCDLWSRYPEIWMQLYQEDAKNEGLKRNDGPVIFTARNSYIARLSNQLNPAAAKFAAVARNSGGNLDSIADTTISRYLDYVSNSNEPRFSYLALWSSLELYYQNMDDNFLSKAGICLTSASNTAAIFDLANIKGLENYLIGVSYKFKTGGHAYNPLFYNNEYGIVENISWKKGVNGVNTGNNGTALKYVITKNGWVVMGEYDVYKAPAIRTSLPVPETMNILNRLVELAPDAEVVKENNYTNAKGMPIKKYLQNLPPPDKWDNKPW